MAMPQHAQVVYVQVVGWNVTAEPLMVGKAISKDFCTRNSGLETDCRHCSTWSLLEMPGMNQ